MVRLMVSMKQLKLEHFTITDEFDIEDEDDVKEPKPIKISACFPPDAIECLDPNSNTNLCQPGQTVAEKDDAQEPRLFSAAQNYLRVQVRRRHGRGGWRRSAAAVGSLQQV